MTLIADLLQTNGSTYVNATDTEAKSCNEVPVQHILYQMASFCLMLSYCLPNGKYCILMMHSMLAVACLLLCVWAWSFVCDSTMLGWYFTFVLVNIGQIFYLLYTMRQIKFPKELEEIYESLFAPILISRALFKKLVAIGQIMVLHAGEAYAMENLTRTDRLGLLINGKSVENALPTFSALFNSFNGKFLDQSQRNFRQSLPSLH